MLLMKHCSQMILKYLTLLTQETAVSILELTQRVLE